VIIAGFGCRKGATSDEVAAAFALALARAGLEPGAIAAFAAPTSKGGETGIAAAAERHGLPLVLIPDAALKAAADRALTRSERVVALLGVPSAAETAALAAAGPTARLMGPRASSGKATCALAAPPAAGGDVPEAAAWRRRR